MESAQMAQGPGCSFLTLLYPTSKEQAALNSPLDSATWSTVGKELDLSALCYRKMASGRFDLMR